MPGFRTPGAALAAILITLSAVGCSSSSKTLTFDVVVKNESSRPATVWLTKDGPEYEQEWKAPEDLAIETRRSGELLGGVAIDPGQKFGATISGKFVPGAHGVLRVYGGVRGINDILALSRGNPDRKEVLLEPGYNEFVVKNGLPGIEILPVAPSAPPAPR